MQSNTGRARGLAERCASQYTEHSAHKLGTSDLYRNVQFYLSTFYKGTEDVSCF